jgi:hypothetical protein
MADDPRPGLDIWFDVAELLILLVVIAAWDRLWG